MDEEQGSVEVPTKVTEPVLSVPNPRALQQTIPTVPGQSKYIQLLNVIEELGHEVRPTYAGSRTSTEKMKRGIVHARILVRECLVETEKSARQ
ncbi:PREDICTED: cyclin-dependent kinase 2-associated protein 1-like [Dufourea novaeangliae]|uniref:Cyclin-dependent kinase 2-associated protein 1 n=1 Tax=Dufourea novaeangliae TaxID=178035 RepID=A0A154PIU4_DUFNO|nr:PREDICTED: cyclin-dependent kinase 2-associated protein 1-like [Dufourea novaeangliae]KZC11806.1 Cyclin-dependent kinase 2-associated protein 1 [Dufourea novaeangliae]